MTRTAKNSAHVTNTGVYQENTSVSQERSSSEQETEMQSPSFQPHTSQAQFVSPMFMPYIEGSKMDWTVNDGLYHRFLKCKLKCENILDCELEMLPESKKCKKVIAWSGDFGMDQYVSWCLPVDDLRLDTIWSKYEDFCNTQANEVRARFDLCTSFRQGNRYVDEWYNAVPAQVSLARYPQETAHILYLDIFWFFLKDEEFVYKTINDSSIDLEKFPANKVRQLAKKMEASKATVHHIKQVASDPEAVQINLMRHQCTDLPPSKHKKKQSFKSRPPSHKWYSIGHQTVPPYKKKFDPKQAHTQKDRCSKCGDSKHVEGFKRPTKKFQYKTCNNYGHFTSLCYKKSVSFKSRTPKVHQLQAGQIYMQEDSICGQSEDLTSSNESFCLQVRIQNAKVNSKIPTTSHLITNLAYKLKPHHKRKHCLRARLNTCADVNIMPADVYNLVFHDPELQRLAPSKLEIGTYTIDTMKLVRSCVFYLVHPDTKHLQEVTFYVESNNGSVLLSCATMLSPGLIQPHTRLGYLPPRASLITSSADYQRRQSPK